MVSRVEPVRKLHTWTEVYFDLSRIISEAHPDNFDRQSIHMVKVSDLFEVSMASI